MLYFDELAIYQRNGFEVIVDKTYEDMNPRGHFEEDDVEEIVRKINDYTYDWFMLRVRVMFDGHEMGSHYLGGCLYEEARDVLTNGTAEDCIQQAMKEAVKEALRLKDALKELCLEEMVAE